MSPLPRFDITALGALTRLAAGGQGVVYSAPAVRIQYAAALVFKQYRRDALPSIDMDALEAMPEYLESLPFADGMELLSRAAWPCRLVEENARPVGFVMPAIGAEFYLQMQKASGLQRELAEFQHLLNDDDFIARRGIPLTHRLRFELLAEVAQALAVFHSHKVSVGDLSPKNLLFAIEPVARVYFIDCDAMRLDGRSAGHQLETPGWEVRAVASAEELATPSSDAYKLALLSLRLLAGDQSTRDPDRLPPWVPADVRDLIHRGLDPLAPARPDVASWETPLRVAALSASTSGPVAQTRPRRQASALTNYEKVKPPPIPSPPSAVAKPARANPARSRRNMAMAVVVAAVIVVVVIGTAVAVHTGSSSRDEAAPAGAATPAATQQSPPETVARRIAVGNNPWAVAIDPSVSSAFVTNSADGTVSVLSTSGYQVVDVIKAGRKPSAIALDRDRHVAVVTDADSGQLLLIDTQRRSVLNAVNVGKSPYGVAVDPRTHTIFVSNFDDGTVSVVNSGYVVDSTIRVGGHPYGIAVDATSERAYVANAADDTVTAIDIPSRTVSRTIAVGHEPWGVAADGTGRIFVTDHAVDSLSVIDTRSDAVTGTIAVGSGPVGVSVDPNSSAAFVSDHSTNTATLIDTKTLTATSTVTVGANPHGIAVDPAGNFALITDFTDASVTVLER
ncbi:hypothetical protein FOS14_23025 [Skermania sp. ID1734]|uniref:hypothetical protein n=1 Tax=Skermania sp. ID1734 TaxID=2597516 RepID=UPI00117D7F88|nr:hypothetical protein [Skermania sp. ID1734]TSD93428.1 hypothetical protein FOS14_23025 [Skermania sp. ID1734]